MGVVLFIIPKGGRVGWTSEWLFQFQKLLVLIMKDTAKQEVRHLGNLPHGPGSA